MKNNLIEMIQNYNPYNPQEEADKVSFLQFLSSQEDVSTRKNLMGHLTASAWIINRNGNKALMVYHNIYNSWSWTGGHSDGELNLLEVAIKEAKEETGIELITPYFKDIFSLEVLNVEGHIKRNHYVSSHLHYNVTYLLIADDTQQVTHNPEENADVKWFDLEAAVEESSEPYMKMIYSKLNEKAKAIYIKEK